MRWTFLLLLLLNVFPSLFATNNRLTETVKSSAATIQSHNGVKSLWLLSEVDAREQAGSPAGESDGGLPERRELACFVIGPLLSLSLADRVGSVLSEQGYEVHSKWREVEAGLDYWVYLPAQPSVRATSRLIQELSANEIDSFVIPEGELEGALAVGVFAVEANANQQKARLVDMGYAVDIQSVQRWSREYWLLLDEIPRSHNWQAVLSAEEDGGIPQKMSRRSCKTVASAMRFQ